MDRAFPRRVKSHQLEALSVRFFEQALPKNWATEKRRNDYGVDLSVDLFEGENATGLELLVQLKASAEPTGEKTETITLKTATYNLLWGKLQVVILVKYVEAENEAYWLLLKDVPPPTQKHKTFTVRIPRENRLSIAPWREIQVHVRQVTDAKLAAIRRADLERRTDQPASIESAPVIS
jgi:Domain of unknown function (DUF4365)